MTANPAHDGNPFAWTKCGHYVQPKGPEDCATCLREQLARAQDLLLERARQAEELLRERDQARAALFGTNEDFLDRAVLCCAIDAFLAGADAQFQLLKRWQENGTSAGLSGNVLEVARQIVRRGTP